MHTREYVYREVGEGIEEIGLRATARKPVWKRGKEGDMVSDKPIRSFRDLEVYQTTYQAMLIVMEKVIPQLPDSERFDLKDQLSRSCKAIPRLIAEGYGKRHQRAGFQKYLDDAMGECNETMVSLEQCRDIYHCSSQQINELVSMYDRSGRQIYRLSEAWTNFKKSQPNPLTKLASSP